MGEHQFEASRAAREAQHGPVPPPPELQELQAALWAAVRPRHTARDRILRGGQGGPATRAHLEGDGQNSNEGGEAAEISPCGGRTPRRPAAHPSCPRGPASRAAVRVAGAKKKR